ncbi:hypothetical protein EDD22DRAFT_947811 [Suillus occidentalis]|nr:hypothetical protein EDD22DRAFT_947811 [Suillus occidentalis]
MTQGNPEASERRRRMYIVASDLSEESRYAVEWGIGTVIRDGDHLLIVTVVENEKKVDPPIPNQADRAVKLRSQQERQGLAYILVTISSHLKGVAIKDFSDWLKQQPKAEEERIINVLSRKLEQLREEKIQLESALEAESESLANRLSWELSALRLQQQQQQQQQTGANGIAASPDHSAGGPMFMADRDPMIPSAEFLLEAMRRENKQLRNRLVEQKEIMCEYRD